jgi:hypothetical protein
MERFSSRSVKMFRPVSNLSGWYAFVLSAGGAWINTYGALPGGGVGWYLAWLATVLLLLGALFYFRDVRRTT